MPKKSTQKKKANLTINWGRTPDDSVFSGNLVLPSFGIRVTRSDPSAVAVPAGWGNYDIAPDSGDAYSVSYLYDNADIFVADQNFRPLDPAYLRRILLRILDDEEYQGVVEHHQSQARREVRPDLPEGQNPTWHDMRFVKHPNPRAQVRITDLRLANAIKPLDLTLARRRRSRGGVPLSSRRLRREPSAGTVTASLRRKRGLRGYGKIAGCGVHNPSRHPVRTPRACYPLLQAPASEGGSARYPLPRPEA